MEKLEKTFVGVGGIFAVDLVGALKHVSDYSVLLEPVIQLVIGVFTVVILLKKHKNGSKP